MLVSAPPGNPTHLPSGVVEFFGGKPPLFTLGVRLFLVAAAFGYDAYGNVTSVTRLADTPDAVTTTFVYPAGSAAGAVARRVGEDGAALFGRIWTPVEGLGPLLNAQSCTACHAYPTVGGTNTKRSDFVVISPENADSRGGRVFQLFQIRPNGSTVPRAMPRQTARRKPPSLLGIGLLEAAAIPKAAENIGQQGAGHSAGRFGWKNRFKTIDDAVAAAFANELGLLGPSLAPERPEISGEQIALVSQFLRTLPPPTSPRSTEETRAGRRVFDTLGCGSCHRPTLHAQTSPSLSPRNRVFEAYTDLALHDLGQALGDGFDTGEVRGSEFRTPPLWGLSQSGPPYLHDGRADTLERAIELHGGEAQKVRGSYLRLSNVDRKGLLAFLRSL